MELKYFKDVAVSAYVDREGIRTCNGNIIGTKWVITNKGDTEAPDIRARLVGKEFLSGSGDSLYASTPPLEALRFLLSSAAAVDEREGEHKGVIVSDVLRAYVCAKATRDLFIEVPDEDPLKQSQGWLDSCVCAFTAHGTQQ